MKILSKDKLKHFTVSLVLVLVISFFYGLASGVIATMLIGLLKEFIWDYTLQLGTCDKYDIYANTVGTIVGVIVFKLLGG